MPRVSKPLQVSPEELETLKSNLAHADEGLSERIRIVMACSEENSNKTVAARLHMDEHTVAKWKKAYQEKGINGLLSSHGGGRKAKHDGENLEEQITALLSGVNGSLGKSWTLKALADKTGASEYQISVILKKLNISLSRKHVWNYQTSKTNSYPGSPEIIGIYLTGKRRAIVTAYREDGIVTSSGEFCTGNRTLVLKLEQSDERLSRNALMTECGFYRDDGKDETVTLEDFIRRLVNEGAHDLISGNGSADKVPAGSPVPVMMGVFVFSEEQFASHQIWPANVDYCRCGDRKEWLTKAHSWFGARASGAALTAFEDTIKAISSYLDRCGENGLCAPFIWSSRIIRTGSEQNSEQTSLIPESASESAGGKTAPDNDSSDSGIEGDSNNGRSSWLTMYENIDKNDAVQSGFIFFAKGKNGIEFGSVVNDRPMPDSDFGFDSEEEFLKGMNQLEQQMLAMRDKAGVASAGLYIDQVKKKKKR